MRQKLLTALSLLACGTSAYLNAKTLTGTWSGKLDLGGLSLGLVMHISDTNGENGLPAVTLDSPDQGAKGIPVHTDFYSPDSIAVSMPQMALSYSGKLEADTLKGTFTQMGNSLPLKMTRGESVRLRPQTPKPPFPYTNEEVTITVEDGDYTLAGTLTLPEGANADTPVVVMVTGSGLQDRDETLFGHKPFAVLADRLARAGIGSLRYDERGVPPSTGEVKGVTTIDFAYDTNQVMMWALKRGFKNVGILGHSEGGLIGFMLSNYAGFIVTMGAPAIPGCEIMLDQLDGKLAEMGLNKDERERAGKVLVDVFKAITTRDLSITDKALEAMVRKRMGESMNQWSSPKFKEWETLEAMRGDLSFILDPWMLEFLCSWPAEYIEDGSCPALALYGEKDTQVRAEPNAASIHKCNPNVKVKVYEGLNHLMQPCQTGKATEYAEIETTIDEAVITDIIAFIKSL